MMRLPRMISSVAIAAALAAPVVYIPSVSWAQAEAPAATPENKALRTAVENYWHYGRIGRYDLAAAEGRKVLESGAEPLAVLEAFEAVVRSREGRDVLDEWLLRFQGIDQMSDVTNQIIATLQQGYVARRTNPSFIDENIQRLSVNERAYQLALGRLRESGELAIPVMVDYLRDSAKSQHHAAIRRALVDLGRLSLNPLVAATEMKDQGALIQVIGVLGNLGYDAVVPYLARLANGENTPGSVKQAAGDALARLGAGTGQIDAADGFYNLGEKFYYGNASIVPDTRNGNVAFVWFWDEAKGLVKKDVPASIYNDVMAMRANEYALKLNPEKAEAVSLWLAANYKREADLPEGASDPTRAENQPSAHYYGVASGTRYLNQTLSRALSDRNSAVALRAVKSLAEIAGSSNLFSGGGEQPVISALRYPDRLVRFEAAMALASALPEKSFTDQNRVVPILAEAIAQTGKTQVLIINPNQNQLNQLTEALKGEFGVASGTDVDSAIAAAEALPTVDVVLVSNELGAGAIDQVKASESPKLAGPAVRGYDGAADAASVTATIQQAKAEASVLPLDEEAATGYAMRAAELLEKIAIADGEVLDVTVAEPTLLQALRDSRAELVKEVGVVLSLINSKAAQSGLLDAALAEQTAEEAKVSLFKSVASNAKRFGNQLSGEQVEALLGVVQNEQNLEIRSAAAEAFGALNLPADQARTLIVEQSRI